MTDADKRYVSKLQNGISGMTERMATARKHEDWGTVRFYRDNLRKQRGLLKWVVEHRP